MIKKLLVIISLLLLQLVPNMYYPSSAHAAGQTYNYTYDKAGRLLTKTLPFGLVDHYTYDANGNLIKKTKLPKEIESFESGRWESTNYKVREAPEREAGVQQNNALTGSYAVYVNGKKEWMWDSYLISDSQKLPLAPNTSYTVSFKYKVLVAPGAGGFFDFFVRTEKSVPDDRGWLTWNDAPGTIGTKTVTFTTGSYNDYQLYWGMSYGGSILLDDIRVVKNAESFESGNADSGAFKSGSPGYSGVITNDPAKVVTGSYSFYGASHPAWEWNGFLISDAGKLTLEPNTTYTVSFKYKVTALPGTGGYHYFFAGTSAGGADKGNTTWNDPAGTVASKRITFTTDAYSDYVLYWGTKLGGAISIDDIRVEKVTESFESGTTEAGAFKSANPGYSGVVTNDPAKVVTGAYAFLGVSDPAWKWNSFLTSDTSRLALEPNTAYTVTFNYKVVNAPSADGYNYFMARTLIGGTQQDRGYTQWTDPSGTSKNKEITFTTGAFGDYALYWGNNNGGALSIDDIQIKPAAK